MRKTNQFATRSAHCLFLFLLPLLSYAAQSAAPRRVAPTRSAERARSLVDFGKLPLAFEINRGQTDPQVKFLARGKGYALFLAPEEAVLKLTGRSTAASTPSDPPVLRMRLMGANPAARVQGAQELPGKSNYFIGNDPKQWRSDIPTFARVQYKGVYPGVDLVYYGAQGQLEYDFVVAPGADPGRIALQFDGAQAKLAANGDLLLAVPVGTGKVMCKVSSLANAGTVTINLTVKVTAGSGSTITDTASVTSTTFDPNTMNNSAKAQTHVN